jgi:hypothetical protein
MKLHADETCLIGHWVKSASGVIADDVAQRIVALTSSHLNYLATDSTGWKHLYADPEDGRLWELTYPHSEWHGGGPPCLQVVSKAAALQKYGWRPPEPYST